MSTETKLASWELPDSVWERMEPLIPPPKSKVGRPRTVDPRRIAEGICYVLRTGMQWHTQGVLRPSQHRLLLLLPVGERGSL